MTATIARRSLLGLVPAVLLAPALARAQDPWPARSLRIIVPFAAGGGADAVARALAQKLQESLGQQVVVDNRPGGAGNIGTEAAARAAPDGYTLLLTGPSHVINAYLFRSLPFDPVDGFVPVSLLTSAPYVLVAAPNLPQRGLAELIAAARSAPGSISYGSAGNGTAGHLAMEMIKAAAGIDMVHVPYRGSPALLTDLMAGRVAIAFDNIISSSGAIAAGQLRALAVSSSRRASALPAVPTVAEAALPGFDVTVWQGALLPAGTDPAIAARLAAACAVALRAPEIRARLDTLGVEAIGGDPDGFARFLAAEHERWGDAVRRSGARLD
ncbi:Bug family tripartite tricarboxylate transporter substrate binding protein [Roseomonas rosulenta]|uniref:Bug family tripartite tricarboxylate transporter substrate binding protein n=1 Tax=Roseomonas rosulenta TaxID=2748667 RepID=UPI0018E0424B|nr:tripartite tricarboxylate transporter substrate-binding protein [Roseomonas rosulenta]